MYIYYMCIYVFGVRVNPINTYIYMLYIYRERPNRTGLLYSHLSALASFPSAHQTHEPCRYRDHDLHDAHDRFRSRSSSS